MDNVLADLRAELGDLAGYSVVYRDSTGRWDGVRLEGRCVVYYSLNEQTADGATSRLLHPLE